MPTIYSLPDELLLKIVRYAIPFRALADANDCRHFRPNATALALSVVSKLFRSLAQPMLYLDIAVKTGLEAQKLLASAAFARYHTARIELELCDEECEEIWDSVGTVTVKELIQSAGTRGLKELKLLSRESLDAALLAGAGAELKFLKLDLFAPLELKDTGTAFPFKLYHFDLQTPFLAHHNGPPHVLSALIRPSISTLRSLSLGSPSHSGPEHSALLYLPEFPSLARHITSLTLNGLGCPTRTPKNPKFKGSLAYFSSLVNLTVTYRHPVAITELLHSLPSNNPTITHLTLRLVNWADENANPFKMRDKEVWYKVMNSKALAKLEVLSWLHERPQIDVAQLELLKSGRDVEMEFESEGEWAATLSHLKLVVRMILDEPPPGVAHSEMSLSSFPPRPVSERSHDSNFNEPLLPYAFRHGLANPTSFEQYPVGSAGGAAGGWGTHHLLGSGRGRFKLLVLGASACLLFLLHAHFYRPRHHGGPPPFWPPPPFDRHGPPPPPELAANQGLPESSPAIHEALRHPPIITPAYKLDPEATPTATANLADALPILPSSMITQPRRATPPTSPNPWPSLPEDWPGHALLSASRFPTADPYSSGYMVDPPLLSPPPARVLSAAFEWAVKAQEEKIGGRTMVAGTGWDKRTGRPTLVERETIVMGDGEWEKPNYSVRDIEEGKGVEKAPKVQWEGEVSEGAEEDGQRREWVKRAFLHVWEGYK
ncbi:hypothetical protein P7C70_g4894, partial [Phenoliferia sp. Uapishka_3]